MTKYIKIEMIFIILMIMMMAATMASAQGTGLYLADYLVNLNNFTTFGHISLADRPKPLSNQATMKVFSNSLSLMQPKSNLPFSETLGKYGQYAYNFDFSLKNFAIGDKFRINLHYIDDFNFVFLECEVKTGIIKNRLSCTLWQHQDGIDQNIYHNTNTYGSTAEFFTNEEEMTLVITKTNYHLSFFLWAKNQPRLGRLSAVWAHPYGDLPSAKLMQIRLERQLVQSERAELSIHQFFYTDPSYYFKSEINLLSQRDEQWSEELLGHTTDQTIGEIGCLLTSVTMLFRAQRYYQFPDATQLNPSGLNNWLKQQKDGYINKNLLNMAAVTRLSNQLQKYYAEQNMTYPKFEYQYIDNRYEMSKNYMALIDAANQNQGIIVEIPGHFVVSDGINLNNIVSIKDPYYSNYDRLSQHQDSNIVSLRRLVPSYTDQSYLIVNVIGDADVEIKNEEWLMPEIVTLFDPLTNEIVGKQFLYPKIQSGNYQLKINPLAAGTKFSFFVYNQEGEVMTYANEELTLEEQLELKFLYDKQAAINFYQEEISEMTMSEKWQKLLREQNWQFKFVEMSLNHWWQKGEIEMVKRMAKDYQQRNILESGELNEILMILDN